MQNSVAKKLFAVGVAASTVLLGLAPFAASATAHSLGTNIVSSDGTVWTVTTDSNGNVVRRPYTSGGAFISYGFNSWGSIVPANADDLALTAGAFLPPADGSIICSDRGADKGTCYLITGGQKAGFTSSDVFTGRGFSFANSVMGDVSWMTSTSNINDTTSAHRPGVLVNNNGTVQLIGANGLLGIPDIATFNTWGYSFKNVVPANAADKAMTQTGVMAARVAGQFNPSALANLPGGNPTGGALGVSLASVTPSATNVPAGAAFLPFTAFNFSAGANAVTVTQVVVHRGGLGADSNFNNLYLFNGNQMLAQSSSFQNGAVTFMNSAGLFTVPANSTMTVWVKGDLSSTASSGLTYSFGLNSASDIVSNASSVSGTFPVTGNLITTATVSSPALASLTTTAVSTGGSVNAGTTGFLAGQFTLTSANSNVKVTSVTLTFVGSAALSSIQNVKLMANGTQIGSTLASPSTNVMYFDLSGSPLMVGTGNTVNLQVLADIMGSANRTGNQFTIQHNYDVQGYDTTYNVGILSGGTFPSNGTSFTINAGSLTVSRDPQSRTAQVAPGQTNVSLATFDFQANGEDVKILNLPFSIARPSGSGNLVINNIKLVDNSGFGLGTSDTTQKTVTSTAYTNNNGAVVAPGFQQGSNFNYVVPANTTKKLSIVADIVSTTTATAVQASLTTPSAGNAQGVSSVASITTPSVSGNTLTVSSSSLSVVSNSAMANPSKVVPGASGTRVASFTLNAGGADSVDVTTLQVTLGNTSVGANFQNLRVMVTPAGGTATQFGQTQTSLTNAQAYSFSGQTINVPAGGSVVVDVLADVLTGAETTVNQMISALSAVTAQLHSSGSTVTATGTSTTNGQTVVVAGNGSVTVSQSPSTPVSRELAMNQTSQILGVIKFAETTGNEAANLTDLTITATAVAGTTLNGSASASLNTLLNFTISATDNTGAVLGSTFARASWSSGTDGTGTKTYTVTFNNIGLPIPQGPNSYMNLTVKANTNSFTNGAASNSQWTVGLANATDATIRGASSNATITPTLTTNANSNTTTVLRTTIGIAAVGSITSPVAVTVNPSGSVGTNENMAIFAVTANSGADAILKTITLQQGGTAPTAVGVVYSVYDASNGLSTSVGFQTLTGTTANAVTLNGGSAATDAGVRIPAGQTKYLVVQANTTNFNTGSSGTTKSFSLQATTWTFSDGTTIVNPSGDASSVAAVTSTGAARTY